MSTTTTAARYEIVKSSEGGWLVIGRGYSGQEVERIATDTRESARRIARTAKAMSDDLAAEQTAPVTGDMVRQSPVFAALSPEAVEVIAANADTVESVQAAQLDEAADQVASEQLDELEAVVAPAKKARAKKATTPKAPKVAAPKGELTVVRKLEDGQRFTLRGTGVVKVVGKVRVEKQKYLVEFEDAAGTYGSAEMWANSRLRLV